MEKEALSDLGRRMTIMASCFMIFSSFMQVLKGDYDKWFTRFAVGAILFALWGIMQHLRKDETKNVGESREGERWKRDCCSKY